MARAYLIGGAPRVGKTTLALKLQERHPLRGASTDSLRATLRAATSPREQPDLFYLDSLNSNEPEMAALMLHNTEDIITAANRESEAVWPAVEQFIRENTAAGRDVLVEGVAILPHLVKALDIDYSVIYLGNQSPHHAAIIHDYSVSHPDAWLGSLRRETVDAFAHFAQLTSVHIENEAAKYGQPYLEMGSRPFPDSIHRALAILMPKK